MHYQQLPQANLYSTLPIPIPCIDMLLVFYILPVSKLQYLPVTVVGAVECTMLCTVSDVDPRLSVVLALNIVDVRDTETLDRVELADVDVVKVVVGVVVMGVDVAANMLVEELLVRSTLVDAK